MNSEELKNSLSEYQLQLEQVEQALRSSDNANDINNLKTLREDLNELLKLTKENLQSVKQNDSSTSPSTATSLDDEYALFMAEMSEVGAVDKSSNPDTSNDQNVKEDFKSLENMKCQAPFDHPVHGISYHNALICGVLSEEEQQNFEDIKVRVLYTHSIYQEMLPCPYFLDSECKFSEEKCRFSHGDIVPLASLKEYKEPNFEMNVGSRVLVKLPTNKLWQFATLISISEDHTCVVRTTANKQETEVNFENIFPLNESNEDDSDDSSSDSSDVSDIEYNEAVVEQSLINTPTSQALGSWEKYTKGIGSKLMQKMGYVVGTGLGTKSDGRIEPVDAVLLPSGKSLDHCMELREKAGGDVNFFKVEKKLQRLQKKQEERNQRAYEREKAKTDVFSFLNKTLKHKNSATNSKSDPSRSEFSKSKHRRHLQTESSKQLNVNSIKVDEDIKKCQTELLKISESLIRHSDKNSVMNKNLKARLLAKQMELDNLKACERNIENEQSLRRDKKKLTIF